VWYQVDAGDGDAATFFYYLRRARRQESLPLLEPHAVGDLGIFARRFFRDFFGAFSAAPLLVLDNFHLAEGSGLASLVRDACQEIPDGGNVIVISRDAPPAEFARLRASRQLGLMGWDELRFTIAEVAQLLPAGAGTGEALVQSMHDRSGGWAAALVLMLENLRGSGRSMPLAPTAAADEQTVFDYLASEVFDNFDAKTRHMLLHVCDLPSVTAQQAVAMADDPDAGRLLEQLYRRGYFTDLRLGPTPAFQLHGLFRDFLRQRAENLPSAQRLHMLDRAARLLAKEGQLEQAIALFARAHRWSSAVRLILKGAPGFLRTGRGPVLATQLRSLPAQVMAQEAWLGYWLGMCHLREEPHSARTTLEQAYLAFVSVADVKGQLFAAAAVVETYYFEWSVFAPLDRWIERLAALLPQARRLPADAKATIYSSAMVAMLYRQPRHPLLPNLAREVHDALFSEAISEPDQKMTTGTFLLNYYNWCGDVARAGQIAAEMTPLARRPEVSPVRRAWWCLRLAYHEFLLARHDHAFSALDRARSEAEAYGLVAVRNVAALYEMFVRLSRGEISACEALSADLERQIVPSRRLDVAIAHYQRSWLAFMRNDDESALRHARSAAALADEAGVPNIHGYFLVASALGEAR
jgi:ATP/maltotriose-dependent transcriptional regulator MalT